ncbi:hypothetical protein V8C86DRAFT_2682474 [Haematococcus lacustris]
MLAILRRPILAKLVQRSQGVARASLRPVSSSTASPGLIEVREYYLKPEGMAEFVRLAQEFADLRQELLPFLGMFTVDIGALQKLTHFYAYKDFDERDAVRGAAAGHSGWRQYVQKSRPLVSHQTNKIMLEAGAVYQALGLPPAAQYKPPANTAHTKVMYELRSYQLHPGYGSVPKLVQAFAQGLPGKVAADPEGQLVLFAHTDVGMLNNVVELWRYPSAQACIRARQAARAVPGWKDTIASVTPGVQHFTSEFMHPTAFSPWA